jgi:hypothetical protein
MQVAVDVVWQAVHDVPVHDLIDRDEALCEMILAMDLTHSPRRLYRQCPGSHAERCLINQGARHLTTCLWTESIERKLLDRSLCVYVPSATADHVLSICKLDMHSLWYRNTRLSNGHPFSRFFHLDHTP